MTDTLRTLKALYDFIADITYVHDGHRYNGYKEDVELDKCHPGIDAALEAAKRMLEDKVRGEPA